MPLSRQSGFTLVELMVTIAVGAILLLIGIPSFQAVINSSRLTSAANEMVSAVQSARAEAIRYNKRTEVCLSLDANAASPVCAADNATAANGWIAFIDADKSGAYNSSTDTLIRVATVNSAVSVLGSAGISGKVKVVFRSDGLARTTAGSVLTGVVQMCIPSNKAENLRYVRIKGGLVSVTRATATGACAAPASNDP